MIIADKDGEFKIKIPDDIIVYEGSWWGRSYVYSAAYGAIWHSYDIYIDKNPVERGYYGKLTPIQLSQGVFHTITAPNSESRPFGIALVYKEP
jgi:hypothetical protein